MLTAENMTPSILGISGRGLLYYLPEKFVSKNFVEGNLL